MEDVQDEEVEWDTMSLRERCCWEWGSRRILGTFRLPASGGRWGS